MVIYRARVFVETHVHIHKYIYIYMCAQGYIPEQWVHIYQQRTKVRLYISMVANSRHIKTGGGRHFQKGSSLSGVDVDPQTA